MSQKTEYIPFRCSPRLRARLEVVAQTQEITVSEVIRLACEHYASDVCLPAVPVIGELSAKGTDWNSIHSKLAASQANPPATKAPAEQPSEVAA
jgi:hypothetical protein